MQSNNATIKALILSLMLSSLLFYQCSEDNIVEPVPTTVIQLMVKSAADSSVIAGANVVLYNANTGESVSRTFSGNDGIAKFEDLSAGNFYSRISAQGFNEVPQGSVSPVPFSVSSGQTFSQTYYMDELQGTFGKIDGTVTPNLSGFLIVATSSGMNTEYHTYSGPDGYFCFVQCPL